MNNQYAFGYSPVHRWVSGAGCRVSEGVSIFWMLPQLSYLQTPDTRHLTPDTHLALAPDTALKKRSSLKNCAKRKLAAPGTALF
jgi:hypothetical protein